MIDDLQALARKLAEPLRGLFIGYGSGYVEGTWTPTYVGASTAGSTTYTGASTYGAYTRIGNTVLFQARVVWTAATGTGTVRISLPIAASSTENFSVVTFRTEGVTFGGTGVQGYIPAGASYVELISMNSNAASTVIAVEAAGDIIYAGHYFV